jgi:glutathione S-transferase
MKLYVCWTTLQTPRPPHGHPCHNAHAALREAGYEPEVIKTRGLGIGPIKLITDRRREVQELTGSPVVPVLVTDDGEVINESQRIVEWAKEHPATSSATTSA